MPQVTNLHVVSNTALPTPAELMQAIPRNDAHAQRVASAREQIEAILHGRDPRFLVIVGPCSIHDIASGREYARRLAELAAEVNDTLLVVMRVYFEKPRTTVGWKGLIMDPHLDGTNDIPAGLTMARSFLREVIDLGLPTATEMLDPITPQYIADLTCWSAIGARTTESQTHRQMASGLSMPVGFKNATSGGVIHAINAIKAAMAAQTFLGISEDGRASVVTTTGNPHCHAILRGGDEGPNYQAEAVATALSHLAKHGLPQTVMIDASHANCNKDQRLMPGVFRDIVAQRAATQSRTPGSLPGIHGAMLESHLVAGAQPLSESISSLTFGQSITDQCIDWDTTQALLREARLALKA